MRAQRTKSDEAKKNRRKRQAKTRPWKVLKEDWFRFMRARYDRTIVLSPWGPKEEKLARKFLEDANLELASKMAELFIDDWDKDGLPSFGYFWTARDTYRAMVEGTIKRGTNDINEDEYNEKRDGSAPIVGWG